MAPFSLRGAKAGGRRASPARPYAAAIWSGWVPKAEVARTWLA